MSWFKNFVVNNLISALALPTGATAVAFLGYLAYALSDGHLSSDEISHLMNILGGATGGLSTYLGAVMLALNSKKPDDAVKPE